MKLTNPTILIVALTAPVLTKAYSFGLGPFYSPFRLAASPACRTRRVPDTFGLISPFEIMRETENAMEKFRESAGGYSPRYQIVDNDEKFQVSLDVPGVKAEDIKISLEEDGKFLTLSGSREMSKEGYIFSSKFSQSFFLDPTIDNEKFTASLQSGVLTVSAPKDVRKIEEAIKQIPITEIKDETAPNTNEDSPKEEALHETPMTSDDPETIDLDETKPKGEGPKEI